MSNKQITKPRQYLTPQQQEKVLKDLKMMFSKEQINKSKRNK